MTKGPPDWNNLKLPEWDAAQLASKRCGEAHAAEMLAAGQAVNRSAPKPKLKKGTLRPDRWATCPVCHAPAINPATGQCEMASCETNPRSSEPSDRNADISTWSQ